jgi:uncharacterized protein
MSHRWEPSTKLTPTAFEHQSVQPDFPCWPDEWQDLVYQVVNIFDLDIDGIHGIYHWTRVLENGLRLAENNGANTKIIIAFSLLHDCRRENDGYDPEHGFRGAEYGRRIRNKMPGLSDTEFDLFHEAATYHSDGLVDGDLTVQTCWDADRLDLYRVGIMPNPNRLCTEVARKPDVIEWAVQRSCLE